MSIVYKNKSIMSTFKKIYNMHNLAEIFKREKVNGKSQKGAADFLKIDHRSVSRHMKQKSIGLDILYKYAEYLECKIEDFITQEVSRQINGYVKNNQINFYGDAEERPVLHGYFAASWWWDDKKTIIIIDKNDAKGVYYNMLNFYTAWRNPIRIKDQMTGIYQRKDTQQNYGGIIHRKTDQQFICRNFYDAYPTTIELTRVAKFICAYTLNDLPLSLK